MKKIFRVFALFAVGLAVLAIQTLPFAVYVSYPYLSVHKPSDVYFIHDFGKKMGTPEDTVYATSFGYYARPKGGSCLGCGQGVFNYTITTKPGKLVNVYLYYEVPTWFFKCQLFSDEANFGPSCTYHHYTL